MEYIVPNAKAQADAAAQNTTTDPFERYIQADPVLYMRLPIRFIVPNIKEQPDVRAQKILTELFEEFIQNIFKYINRVSCIHDTSREFSCTICPEFAELPDELFEEAKKAALTGGIILSFDLESPIKRIFTKW